MSKDKIPQHKKLALGEKVGKGKPKMAKGGVAKGTEVKVKHVAMKKGGKVGKKGC